MRHQQLLIFAARRAVRGLLSLERDAVQAVHIAVEVLLGRLRLLPMLDRRVGRVYFFENKIFRNSFLSKAQDGF